MYNTQKTLHNYSMKSFFELKNKIKSYITMILGTFLMAIAVIMFFDKIGVVAGGVTGIAIILKQIFEIPMWVVNTIINIPLFIMSFKLLDKDIFIKTLVCTVSLTLFLGVVPRVDIDLLLGDRLVDIILGATVMGIGLGLIFLQYASSGGTDLLATLINLKMQHLSVPKILAVIDGIIVVIGMGVFGFESGIYAIIAIYIVTKVSDSILAGPDRAKLLYIISDNYDEISGYIVNDVRRGVSYIEVKGGFTDIRRPMIMCVASAKEMVKIKQKIYQIDEKAICFVGDIREAFGEGFTKFRG